MEYPLFVVLVVLILLCGSETEATENQTVTAFDPSIIFGGSWKTNGSHGINHKNSKRSAIYYTGEINSGASAVEILIDSVTYSVLNISHQARIKGIKNSESDVEILFSAEDLDPQSIHTFTLRDYDEKDEKEKFITLYRLTVTTGSTSNSSSDTHNQATETNSSQVYGMEASTNELKPHKRTAVEATLGVLFGIAVLLSLSILLFRLRRKSMYKQSILESVTPFIVRSHWWQIAAGARFIKLVAPDLKRAAMTSRLSSHGRSDEGVQIPRAEMVEAEVQNALQDPPPEYVV
ncbi:hypothetical protein SCHPADRAFT_945295 [Schizopora paradoxa]|uniref:Uncharacterized protein n=1 Tax=Schizopora paradoxa TaxID=27342 RepID=A0A0H2R6K5_9AGAM|nr:hypothetical protein SCHPADRAFT_945295 [Schizopora paradoxa]